uniref:BHLH domain-containing protein n=1 Tax=Ditylenchus dipsaci TaxID=166011 RepID=A0A915E0C7_9BILA
MTGIVKKSTNSPMLQLPSTSLSTMMPWNCSFSSSSQDYNHSFVQNSPHYISNNPVHQSLDQNHHQLWNWPNAKLQPCANYFETVKTQDFLKAEDENNSQLDEFLHQTNDRSVYARSSSEGKPVRNSATSLRRYKTPSPKLLRVRREAANARERRRMNHLNVAFEQLRTVLPEMDNGRRLSKFETLQMAQQYIDCLNELLCRHSR